MLTVIDTNVLVSALLSRQGGPARILSMVLRGDVIPCYDYRILCEYREVLERPRFGFSKGEVNALLDWIEYAGQSVLPDPVDEPFVDESDRKFYEVALYCNSVLVTGNLKHYPPHPLVLSVPVYLEKFYR